MAIPQQILSTETVAAAFLFPRNTPRRPLIDYEYGGVDLQDGSRGIRVKVWKGEYLEGQIVLSAQDIAPVPVLTVADVVDFQFTFDRNMQPFVAYELANGTCRFYWFDTLISNFTTTTLAAGSITPRCAHDDNRNLQTQTSDIIVAYCRSGSLYYREQRERYQTERLLSNAVGNRGLIQVGMNRVLRFQFQLSTA